MLFSRTLFCSKLLEELQFLAFSSAEINQYQRQIFKGTWICIYHVYTSVKCHCGHKLRTLWMSALRFWTMCMKNFIYTVKIHRWHGKVGKPEDKEILFSPSIVICSVKCLFSDGDSAIGGRGSTGNEPFVGPLRSPCAIFLPTILTKSPIPQSEGVEQHLQPEAWDAEIFNFSHTEVWALGYFRSGCGVTNNLHLEIINPCI